MITGGYQIVDLKNTTLTAGSETGVVISGAYNSIANNDLPILLKGVKIGNISLRPYWVNFRRNSAASVKGTVLLEGFNNNASLYEIIITSDDEVYLTLKKLAYVEESEG